MSHPVEINDEILEMLLITDEPLTAESKPIQALLNSLQKWGAIADIKDLTLTRIGGDPNAYDYVVENKSGHHIITTMTMDDQSDTDPWFTITVTPAWRLSVLGFGGSPRQQLLEIRALVGIVSFVVVFA